MLNHIEHKSGIRFCVKTFRPLLIFPWLSSINRTFPMSSCLATISYNGKSSAQKCHKDIVRLLSETDFKDDMAVPIAAVQKYAAEKTGKEIRSVKVYPLSGHEGNLRIQVTEVRDE